MRTLNQERSFYYFLVGMFLLHVTFLVVKFKDQIVTEWAPQEDSIKVRLIQEVVKEQLSHKQQIVRSEDATSDEKPLDPAFLSDKDRKFDRQSVAKKVDLFKAAAKGNAATTQVAQKPKKAQKKAPSLKDLKLSDIGFETGAPTPQKANRAPASLTTKGLENGDPLSHGLSATNDYVQEVALGDFTHLNTVEYKFYGFYNRIREKLEQHWGASIQEKSRFLFRSGRRMPANEDLITSLRITLDDKGEIIGVKIIGASGVKELDDAAVESFNKAGPFPNPPRDLLVNGKATIEWGFVVKS